MCVCSYCCLDFRNFRCQCERVRAHIKDSGKLLLTVFVGLCRRAKQLKPYLHFYSLLSHYHYLVARDSECFGVSCPSALNCLLILQDTVGTADASFPTKLLHTHWCTHTHINRLSASTAAIWACSTVSRCLVELLRPLWSAVTPFSTSINTNMHICIVQRKAGLVERHPLQCPLAGWLPL